LYGAFFVKGYHPIFVFLVIPFFCSSAPGDRQEVGGESPHIDPESCADAREGIGEALTGERIGQAIEP
jgi:hypothetical protein